jgi:hypothetical protein
MNSGGKEATTNSVEKFEVIERNKKGRKVPVG